MPQGRAAPQKTKTFKVKASMLARWAEERFKDRPEAEVFPGASQKSKIQKTCFANVS